jgi:general stress protein 26
LNNPPPNPDNTSHKEDEIHQDSHVNISFVEPTGGDWISIAGTASSTNDREAVKKVYNASVKAWFGDLQDGKHDGSENDPRVAVMTVKPYEVSVFFFGLGAEGFQGRLWDLMGPLGPR